VGGKKKNRKGEPREGVDKRKKRRQKKQKKKKQTYTKGYKATEKRKT